MTASKPKKAAKAKTEKPKLDKISKHKPAAAKAHEAAASKPVKKAAAKKPADLPEQDKPVKKPAVKRKVKAVAAETAAVKAEPEKQRQPAVAAQPAAAPAQQHPSPAAKPVEAPKPAIKPVSVHPAPVSAPKSAAPVHPAPVPVSKPAAPEQPASQPTVAPKPAPQAAQVVKPVEPAPKPAAPPKQVIKVTGQPTVRELAEKIGMKVNDFIKKLMGMGVYATINQRLEPDLSSLVLSECGYELEIAPVFAEQELKVEKVEEEKPENLKPRSPVVTIMGHVDHGKTSLLDAIRSSNLCAAEAGAITQHIGAYKVCTAKGDIAFLDTPGHEAFTAMRARGAQVTDIVILVVSATDGVMPQTIEAIDHAKAAGVPIIVAVNKIDLPGANPERIKQELANSHGLIPEEWQGKTIYVELSAKKRINIDKLLEMISLQAEMMDLKANPDRRGVGSIVEARRDSKRGVVVTVLVRTGKMSVGDPFVVGNSHGRIRALIDEHGARLDTIGPSMPAEILGINGEPPQAGDTLYIVESEKEAKNIGETRKLAQREADLAHQKHVTLLGLRSQIDQHKLKTLQVILKADVQGSIQAIKDSLERIGTDEVEIKIIHSGPGNVNESDIMLAKASDALILAFHVDVESKADAEAQRAGIEIREYTIIYDLLGDVRAAMEGLLEPEVIEIVTGRAEVRQVFNLSSGMVAGSLVSEGKITRSAHVYVRRAGAIIYKGKISGLKRFKEDVKEVEKGFECGISIDGYRDIKPGDTMETIEKQTKMRRLESPHEKQTGKA